MRSELEQNNGQETYPTSENLEIPGFNVKEVLVAGDMGPCGGVNMAIETTFDILDIVGGREIVYANNPPVHNDLIMEEFEQRNLQIEPTIDKIPPGSIWILSAHGTDPSVAEHAEKKGLVVVNAECQLVTKVRSVARKIERDGSGNILYFGTANHPEPKAIVDSVSPDILRSVDIKQDPEAIDLPTGERIWVLNQTTLSSNKVNERVDALRRLHPEAQIEDAIGICDATDNRQRAVREGIFGGDHGSIDMLITVGSTTSHNTEELVNIGREVLGINRSYRIDKPEEINLAWFTKGIQVVGFTSGASVLDRFSEPVLRWFKQKGASLRFLTGVEKDLTFKKPTAQTENVKRHIAAKYNLVI